jgi:hypothetical protein
MTIPTTRIAAVALPVPYLRVMAAPIASSARKEPPARALGGEAERVIFQRLVCYPLIVLASNAVDPLPPCHMMLQFSPRRVPIGKNYVAILRCNIRDLAYRLPARCRPS